VSVLDRRDPARVDLTSRLSAHLTLKRPIVSANMDTVTRAPMAIVQAQEGGIGIIDRGFRPGEIEAQVREVHIVKRTLQNRNYGYNWRKRGRDQTQV
jgi:IMP dehydrogenase/GMP reductase